MEAPSRFRTLARVRVLVVDDSPAVRRRIAARVREAGGHAVEIADAESALVEARAHVPDVVVLDLHLGGMSGLEALPRLKETASAPLVIVMTNHPSEQHRRECLARGADHFFDKANDFDRFAEVVEELVRRGR